ncbi:hypothetical protein F5883DRAFT_529407 [Diaporthe sp. PMI_573]|nr:hypothetical protein F5883DRAFT_529407 [Diaporthaceae sp. PMI_573]
MAGNTPWASQMFPVPTQESVPASMLTGDESYSIKLVSFSKALTQLPDTQGPNQETQAVEGEEAARTADRAEGQQSLSPGHGRQHDDTRTLVAAEGTNTAGQEVPRVEEPAQKAAQEVEGRPQNPPPGGSHYTKAEDRRTAVGRSRSRPGAKTPAPATSAGARWREQATSRGPARGAGGKNSKEKRRPGAAAASSCQQGWGWMWLGCSRSA